jgi:hypothetical protein
MEVYLKRVTGNAIIVKTLISLGEQNVIYVKEVNQRVENLTLMRKNMKIGIRGMSIEMNPADTKIIEKQRDRIEDQRDLEVIH